MTDKTLHGNRQFRGWTGYWQSALLAVAVAMLVVLVGLAIVSLASGG